MTKFTSAKRIHPGEYICGELQARGWTADDLVAKTGLGSDSLRRIIAGRMPILQATGLVLAKVFEQDAETWLDLQKAYDKLGT